MKPNRAEGATQESGQNGRPTGTGPADRLSLTPGKERPDAFVGSFAVPVSDAMTRKVKTLQLAQPIDTLLRVFDRDEVAVVLDGEEFVGLITRVDLINHLRLTA